MLVVSTRPAVRERLKAVSEAFHSPAPTFVSRVEDALGEESSLLILDLGGCCMDPDLVPIIRAWETYHPGSELVLFTPLIERDAELRAVVSVVRETRFVDTRVMTASDFYRDEVWRNLRGLEPAGLLDVDLRTELVRAAAALGRGIRAEALILQLLHSTAESTVMEAARRRGVRCAGLDLPNERRAIWKRLRASRQLPASWLLAIFRLLWYTKLRERGWSTTRIAQHLGYPSARRFRVMLRRRFGISIRELEGVRHADAIGWAAELLVAEHRTLASLSMTGLIEPLLIAADRGGPVCSVNGSA
jgi:hypothetical protein